MLNRNGILFILAFVAAIALVAYFSRSLPQAYTYRGDMAAAAATTITALIAVSLFVERGMAVVNAIVFGDAQRTAEVMVAEAGDQALPELARVLGHKERLRLLGAFTAGLFISAAGVRTLAGLLDMKVSPPATPLFLSVDVVLTAALIAGGSNGLALLLQLAKDRLAAAAAPATIPATPAPATRGVQPASTRVVDPALRARLTTTG